MARSMGRTDGPAISNRGDSLITMVLCDNLAATPYREAKNACGLHVNGREQAIAQPFLKQRLGRPRGHGAAAVYMPRQVRRAPSVASGQ